MNRTLLLTCTGALALALALGVAPASAAPTQATNHQVVEMTCDQLGPIAIEVVNRGHWGGAKIQGTSATLLQAWAEETVWFDGEVVHEDRHAKGNDTIDDTCRFSWSEDLGEQDLVGTDAYELFHPEDLAAIQVSHETVVTRARWRPSGCSRHGCATSTVSATSS